MRILITGGTGFIGSQLGRRLLAAGHGVRVLSLIRDSEERRTAEDLRRKGAEVIEAGVTEPGVGERALAGIDVVHHIAATMSEAGIPDAAFWATNVEGTKALVHAADRAGVRRFVYCSTMGVTGGVRGRRTDESEPYRPGNIYERTKAAAEAWLLQQHADGGLPIVSVRPADVYGPGDRRFLKLFRLIQRRRFVYLGDGHGRRHMIHIDDLVDGFVAAQNQGAAAGEVFLLAGPAPIRLRDLVDFVASELGVARPRLKLPLRPVRGLASLCEVACRPLRIRPPIHPRRVQFFAHDYEFDISKARRILGFEPRIGVEEGVRRTIATYRAQGLLA